MKIGILTVHDSIINYGSFLQASSLYEFLIENGHDVYFIFKDTKELLIKKYYYNTHKNPLKKLYTYLTETKKLENKYVLFENDWKQYKFLNYLDADSLDLIICGSDELWNIRNKDVFDNYYYGNFSTNIPRIAYAISMGDASLQDFIENKDKIDLINKFTSISARDNNTYEILTNLNMKTIKNVCDPTVLRGLNFYKNISAYQSKKEYILIYSYGFDKKLIKLIKRFAKENDLDIISPLMDSPLTSNVPYVSSLEFLSYIKGAKYVVTSTFHGALLSMLLNMNVSVFCTKPKTREILEKYSTCYKEIFLDMNYDNFKNVLNQSIDYKITNQLINNDYNNSINILNNQIKETTYD